MFFNYEVERDRDEVIVRVFDYYLRDTETLSLNNVSRGSITLEKGNEAMILKQDRIKITDPDEELFLISRDCDAKNGYFRLTFTADPSIDEGDKIEYDSSSESWILKRLDEEGMQQRSNLRIEVAETLNDRRTMHINASWTITQKILEDGSKAFLNRVIQDIKKGISAKYADILQYRGVKNE